MLKSYNIIDHYYDVIVIGAGGSGLRASIGMAEKDLKTRYNQIKHSIGIEFRLFAFSFYSFPMAISYEYHNIPEDFFKTKGRQYLKILFDF